jgi:hypothetical protein
VRPVIAAMRKTDLPEPHIPSTEETCVDCGTVVWVSHGTMRGAEELGESFEILCVQCVTARAKATE